MNTPRNGSLAQRILKFFRDNPDEELSRADICVKFDAHHGTVESAITLLRQLGHIERVSVIRLRSKGVAK